jgi:hypothetical protein
MSEARLRGDCLMRWESIGLGAILALASATPTAAQKPGSFELDGFGTWTKFDESLVLKDRFGVGGLLGFFIAKNIALEGDAWSPARKADARDILRGRWQTSRG